MKIIFLLVLMINFNNFQKDKKEGKRRRKLRCKYDLMKSYGLAIGKFEKTVNNPVCGLD